jgi:hypothetical protein
LGCGVIINGIPKLLPMVLDNKGKWIGKLVWKRGAVSVISQRRGRLISNQVVSITKTQRYKLSSL